METRHYIVQLLDGEPGLCEYNEDAFVSEMKDWFREKDDFSIMLWHVEMSEKDAEIIQSFWYSPSIPGLTFEKGDEYDISFGLSEQYEEFIKTENRVFANLKGYRPLYRTYGPGNE